MYALYQNRGADCKTPAETKKITTTATTTTTKRQTGTSGKSKDLKGSPFSLALAVENSDSGSFRPSTESGTNTEQPSRVSETCNARHAATVPPVALQEGSSKYTTGAKSLALASGAHIVREDPSARPGAFSVDGPGSGRTNFERNEAPEATPVTAEAGDDNVVGGIAGTVVGIISGGGGSEESPPTAYPTASPTSKRPTSAPVVTVPACTLCVDGSEPDLDNEIRPGVPCSTLELELAGLSSDQDPVCQAGQARGWYYCSCPSLPPAPVDPVCTYDCPEHALPQNFQVTVQCTDFVTFIELVGQGEGQCEELNNNVFDACECRSDILYLTTVLKGVSDEQLLMSLNTPQYAAMDWLVTSDPANENLTLESVPLSKLQDRYFGALLWFAFGGDNWFADFLFMTASSVCDWNDGENGISCNDEGYIDSVRLDANNLTGAFPGDEFATVRRLRMISLQDNLIVGSLPNNLGNLVGLETFDMNGCSLAGSLPSTIGSAGSLTMLHISDSDLTGSFPTSFCRLSSLVSINLDRNFLTGTLPSVDAMQSLNTLYVNFNRLVGTIPEHYGQLPLLSLLGLYGNGLNGTVPDFSLSDLKFLFLGSNMLSGSFERLLSTFSPDKLQLLSVDTNQLTGTIPASLGNYTLLTFLYLQYNQLTGTLPTELGMLTNVESEVYLEGLSLNGAIPTELGVWTSLSSLNLAKCSLSGTIPSELGAMTALTLLDLHGNRLSGPLPETLGNLSNLHAISFAENMHSGTVPTIMASFENLETFLVQNNSFTGDLNPFFCTRTSPINALRADCLTPSEIVCECCSDCCNDDSGCLGPAFEES